MSTFFSVNLRGLIRAAVNAATIAGQGCVAAELKMLQQDIDELREAQGTEREAFVLAMFLETWS